MGLLVLSSQSKKELNNEYQVNNEIFKFNNKILFLRHYLMKIDGQN
jgi:hypothetical protein